MRIAFFVVLALAVAASANPMTKDLIKLADQKLASQNLQIGGSEDAATCHECVEGVAHHIMHEVIEHIKQHCEEHPSEHCEWMKEHHEFVLGVLLAHVRPGEKGFFVCLGKGACSHPNMNNTLEATDSDAVFFSKATAVLDTTDKMDKVFQLSPEEKFTANDFAGDDEQDEDRDGSEGDDGDDDDGHDGHHHHHHHEFERCVMHSSMMIFEMHLKRFADMCHHTECPFMEKFCERAAQHPEVTRGFLWARTEPEHAAFNFCMGIRFAMEHHHHGHHGHHGHHDGHHHHDHEE